MRALLRKIGFVLRFIGVKLWHYPGLKIQGFIFIEKDVTFDIEPGAQILLKNRVYLKKGCCLECTDTGRMVLEEKVSVGHYAVIACCDRISIGARTLISHHAVVVDSRHVLDEELVCIYREYQKGVVEIGSDVILFAGALVGPNVCVADKTWIMPHSVVTRDILEPSGLWGGIPAQRKKELRFDD